MGKWRDWLIGLMPPLLVLALLAWASGYAVYWRFYAEQAADERALREWLEEARVFRKTLPELCREYLRSTPQEARQVLRQELEEQLQAIAAPLRQYTTHLPLFPTLYRLELRLERVASEQLAESARHATQQLPDPRGVQANVSPMPETEIITWDSGLPFSPQQVRYLEHTLVQERSGRAAVRVWYQLHAFHHQQRLLAEQRRFTWGLVMLVSGVSFLAVAWVTIYSWRQRAREREEANARQRVEEARREALEHQVRRKEAERQALQLRSQMFASIAVLAGSYAHNIKNLLVRPNALLRQCLEQPLSDDLRWALEEVEGTLATVSDRLQEILRTVRREPTAAEKSHFDLNELARELYEHWRQLASERWKVDWRLELAAEPLTILADRSQLMQAVENLLFNARDATFEKRIVLREQAHAATDAESRKQALLHAVSWRGEIILTTSLMPGPGNAEHRPAHWAVLEIRDNGIGMTQEVLQRCTEPYFSTKRHNAAYEGQTTGLGLGLAFVRTIVEQHGGRIEIDSRVGQGTAVRLLLPISTDHRAESPAQHCNHTLP